MKSRDRFWMYRAEAKTPGVPAGVRMTREEWDSLPPEDRRAIVRSLERVAELPAADRAMLALKGMV